jgi:hypothetical protein
MKNENLFIILLSVQVLIGALLYAHFNDKIQMQEVSLVALYQSSFTQEKPDSIGIANLEYLRNQYTLNRREVKP